VPAPLVEDLIPAFNAARWAGPLIDSLRQQTNPRWHATIIDDGSTDATADTIEVTCRALGESRITIIRQPNTGVAAARDAALTHARAPFVCFLDADDLIDPHHAKSLLDALAIADDAAAPSDHLTSTFDAAACGYRLIDSSSVDLGWSTNPQPGDHTFARVLAANRSAMGTVAIRRAALLSIRQLAGHHLADTACLCEDWQLWLNVALHGPNARGWPQDPRGVRWAPPVDRPLLAYRQHPAARSHALRASMNDGFALITHYAEAANDAN